ncbi:hypothetical protein HOY80DRAFT_68804 [Tuber brumale]|nr:hypothetical protein HOY80DRAFT_68804 [Tuber brumale]
MASYLSMPWDSCRYSVPSPPYLFLSPHPHRYVNQETDGDILLSRRLPSIGLLCRPAVHCAPTVHTSSVSILVTSGTCIKRTTLSHPLIRFFGQHLLSTYGIRAPGFHLTSKEETELFYFIFYLSIFQGKGEVQVFFLIGGVVAGREGKRVGQGGFLEGRGEKEGLFSCMLCKNCWWTDQITSVRQHNLINRQPTLFWVNSCAVDSTSGIISILLERFTFCVWIFDPRVPSSLWSFFH